MAGPHQIWKMPLDESEIGIFAGNGREDIVDGPLMPKQPYEAGFASFAQPSGLTSDGRTLFVADSEGSSIRAVPFDPAGEVTTVVGTSHLEGGRRLFTFGDVDGHGTKVRLQHPLGVAFADGTLFVADTYNNKIKAITKHDVKTIAGTGAPGHDDATPTFDEPTGLSVAKGKLYVADTNSHQIRVVDLGPKHTVTTLAIRGLTPPTPPETSGAQDRGREVQVAPVTLKPEDGIVWLKAKLTLPEGYKINAQAPMRYRITLPGKSGPIDRKQLTQSLKVEPPATEFQVELPIAAVGEETVEVALDYYYCREGTEGICKAGRVTWVVPVKVDDKAAKTTAPLELAVE